MDIHKRISGVYPRPPTKALRDDSDADDACDAVFRISLYHIPDSASLASSASFEFCVFRGIAVLLKLSIEHPRHFTMIMTVMTMMTVFVG